jgi:hypothetical protein
MPELVYRTIKPSDVDGQPTVFAIPAPRVAGADPTPPAAPTNQIAFGITFELNGQLVPICTDSIADMAKDGLELGIPGPVAIGSIGDFTTWFTGQFGMALPDPSQFPSPLDKVFDKIASRVWTVNQARVKIPPTNNKADPIRYTLTITTAWEGEGIPLIPNILSIQGAVFGASNETPGTGS